MAFFNPFVAVAAVPHAGHHVQFSFRARQGVENSREGLDEDVLADSVRKLGFKLPQRFSKRFLGVDLSPELKHRAVSFIRGFFWRYPMTLSKLLKVSKQQAEAVYNIVLEKLNRDNEKWMKKQGRKK